ncbi:MAG TPA: acyloxyacyl hydrolase [Azospirillum sp.]|nr:acyloxyacyl hydrolase [Azospirillum sp.]
MPDLLSVGLGAFDSVSVRSSTITPRKRSLDMRVEYRFGYSLLPFAEPYVSVRPWLGLEGNTDGMLYGAGGVLADVALGRVVFTPSFGVGGYRRGGSKHLGSGLEFRTTLELGYRFENEARLSAFFSHISNAGITDRNPGADTVGVYLHLPVSSLFGAR